MLIVGPWGDPLSLQVLEVGCFGFFVWMLAGEISGVGLRYSKFATSSEGAAITVPSRLGMFLMYLPSFLAASSFLFLKQSSTSAFQEILPPCPSACDSRLLLVAGAICLHFLKRLLEVLFVHKYSGTMELSQSVLISSAYATAAVVIIYAQHISAVRGVQPDVDLTNWGLGVFVIGIMGNFYHHYLLASLRSDKTKSMNSKSKYVVPQGGLFTYVVCPHYLFESVTFFGIAMMAQTFVTLLTAVGMSSSLCARSYKTKGWYLKKVEGFPPNRKPFFPFLF